MGDEVRLVDLEVVKRYSLAVRQETAPAEELLEALDASRAAVLAALGRSPRTRKTAAAKPSAAAAPGPSTRRSKAARSAGRRAS